MGALGAIFLGVGSDMGIVSDDYEIEDLTG